MTRRANHAMRLFLKFLHVSGAISFCGGMAAFILILTYGPGPESLDAYAAVRRSVATISSWTIVPGMGLVLISGLLMLAIHPPYQRARWVWVKLASALAVVKLTLVAVDSSARQAAEAATLAASGEINAVEMTAAINDSWVAWWILLGLGTVNVSMAVWRPRLGQRGVL